MKDIFDKAQEAAEYIKTKLQDSTPTIGLSLGTGSSKILDSLTQTLSIPYHEIPNFPHTEVQSHKNQLVYGKLGGTPILCLGGRVHYYEGWSMHELTFPIRVFQLLGIQTLIMTNASGGLNPAYKSGDVVLVKDHINLLPEHPLRGKNDDRLGVRFPDMSQTYSKKLRNLAKQEAQKLGVELQEGVYGSLQGPSLETPAEYKWLHIIGADLVGMSTVPEVIVATHAKMDVLVMSIVTNVCYPPDEITETTVEEVIDVANRSSSWIVKLIEKLI